MPVLNCPDPFVPGGVTVPALCSITIAMIVGVESATLKANAISILGFGMIERLDGTSSIKLQFGGRTDLVPTSISLPHVDLGEFSVNGSRAVLTR
jgi:hypothetical protein